MEQAFYCAAEQALAVRPPPVVQQYQVELICRLQLSRQAMKEVKHEVDLAKTKQSGGGCCD